MDASLPWAALACAIFRDALHESRKRADSLLRAEQDTVRRLVESLEASSHGGPEAFALKDEANGLRSELESARASLLPRPEAQREPEPAAAPPSTALEFLTPPPVPPTSDADSDNALALQSEIRKLRRRFDALSKNFKLARETLERRRDERDKWIKHAAYLESLISRAEEQHNVQILRLADQPKDNVPAAAGSDAVAYGGPKSKPVSAAKPSPKQPGLSVPLDAPSVNTEPRTASDIVTESTQGDDEESGEQLPPLSEQDDRSEARIKQEPSSDVPVVIAERQIRKRKHDDGNKLPLLKLEKGDSSPLVSGSRDVLRSQDSLDLGEIAQKMETPRKRRAHDQSHDIAEATRPCPELSYATPTGSVGPHQQPQSARPSALTPLSVNLRMTRSGGDCSKDWRSKKHQLDDAIGWRADNGGLYGRTGSSRAQGQEAGSASQAHKGRLHMHLHKNSSFAPADVNASSRSAVTSHDDPATLFPIPERRELPFDKSTSVATRPPPIQNAQPPRPNLLPSKQSVCEIFPSRKKAPLVSSLRSRPASELRLDDFKVNPVANNGHGFAFTEVVREKSDRACLPGCTDMYCCGKQFRALALSQRPSRPLTPAQRLEEQRLLEEHLGDLAYRLATMSREERDELWVEAKTQELANKYGKHRHRFSRMQSPPGFWNPDFPTSQELEADRAEAAKRERQVIMERYREATRPGGRWVFRDE